MWLIENWARFNICTDGCKLWPMSNLQPLQQITFLLCYKQNLFKDR